MRKPNLSEEVGAPRPRLAAGAALLPSLLPLLFIGSFSRPGHSMETPVPRYSDGDVGDGSSLVRYAAQPDVVLSQERDLYYANTLLGEGASELAETLLGSRRVMILAPELRALASCLYFGLTNLAGKMVMVSRLAFRALLNLRAGRRVRRMLLVSLPVTPCSQQYARGTMRVPTATVVALHQHINRRLRV